MMGTYAAVINGCSADRSHQAEELRNFVAADLDAWEGITVVLHNLDHDDQLLAECAVTKQVLLVRVSRYQPEEVLTVLEKLSGQLSASLYLFPGNHAGNELSVRLSHRLKGSALVHVSSLSADNAKVVCTKDVYSSHLEGTFVIEQFPCCISVAPGSFQGNSMQPANCVVTRVDERRDSASHIEDYKKEREDRPQGLEEADFVIAVGRGAGSKEAVEQLRKQAGEVNAEFGVTRMAAMNGWAPLGRMIGVSGTIVSPETCIVLGASGAAAFTAGIEKSRWIASVNTDRKAPIVSQSDVAVIGDCRQVMEHLAQLLITGDRNT
ncbi:MAG: electron transfer flavoprotein subunit alpha/FixB family protein [Spirochaetota bacterium]